jgi:hypothetical protein
VPLHCQGGGPLWRWVVGHGKGGAAAAGLCALGTLRTPCVFRCVLRPSCVCMRTWSSSSNMPLQPLHLCAACGSVGVFCAAPQQLHAWCLHATLQVSLTGRQTLAWTSPSALDGTATETATSPRCRGQTQVR